MGDASLALLASGIHLTLPYEHNTFNMNTETPCMFLCQVSSQNVLKDLLPDKTFESLISFLGNILTNVKLFKFVFHFWKNNLITFLAHSFTYSSFFSEFSNKFVHSNHWDTAHLL